MYPSDANEKTKKNTSMYAYENELDINKLMRNDQSNRRAERKNTTKNYTNVLCAGVERNGA